MTPIKVTLVEDSAEYAESIALLFKHTEDVLLFSTYTTAEVAIRSLVNNKTNFPDVILLDLRLPGMDGLSALASFTSKLPEVKVIILTQSDSEEDVLKAIETGASGYVLKSAKAAEIIDAIKIVNGGGAMLDPKVAQYVLNSMRQATPDTSVSLSPRELEVLNLLAEGFVKKEIADKLDISYSTVDYHVGRIYEKLSVRNAPAAVDQAHRLGIFNAAE
ncbi:MAG: response regulator [Opitutales bacterium]